MKIKDLKKLKGVQKVLCRTSALVEVAKNGKEYIKLTFDDGKSTISVFVWEKDKNYNHYKTIPSNSSLTEAELEYLGKNGSGYDEYKLHGVTIKEDVSLSDCVEIEKLKNELKGILKNMKNKSLKEVAFKLCSDEEILEGLFNSPASEKSGYSFKGGLLAHVVRLCKSSIALSEVYNAWNFNKGGFNEGLDTDLLIVCSLLHDIGKVKYYEINDGEVEKTFNGELFESSYLTVGIMKDILNSCDLTEEQKTLIEHAVTASKGSLAFGALNTPRTKEANVFHCLERIDSMMGNFEYMQRISINGEFQKLYDKQYCLIGFDEV